jgi:6-phosphofructokinase 1
MENKIKKIGILCSGGDSPGMNAAIRAVTRTAIGHDLKVVGIKGGFSGIFKKDFIPLEVSSVGNIIQRGGTILLSSRCPEFHEKEFRKKAALILRKEKIDALVCIGGDGTFKGAYIFQNENNFPVMGIPGSIDNDISGTDYTIGFDTAIQTAVEAVDKIRDTAFSHERNFIVEVMGRSAPEIALTVGICTGAENVIFDPLKIDYEKISATIKRGVKRGKKSSIIITCEGSKPGMSYKIQKNLLKAYDIDSKVCILGHIQRGGSPTARDRVMASEMGHLIVKSLISNKFSKVSVFRKGQIFLADLKECQETKNDLDPKRLEIIRDLSI